LIETLPEGKALARAKVVREEFPWSEELLGRLPSLNMFFPLGTHSSSLPVLGAHDTRTVSKNE
jgi:hypothetical protein